MLCSAYAKTQDVSAGRRVLGGSKRRDGKQLPSIKKGHATPIAYRSTVRCAADSRHLTLPVIGCGA